MRNGRVAAAIVTMCAATAAAQFPVLPAPGDLDSVLTRVGERVQEYYRRAQSIASVETVQVQPLARDLTPRGRARVLRYDLRVSWEPAADRSKPPEATVLRQLLTVNGRPSRAGAEQECMDPRAVSPEPLVIMLHGHQEEYLFSLAGTEPVEDRRAVLLDYQSRTVTAPEVTWRGECFSMSLPGRTKGRVWVDAASHEVLRLDESLVGTFDYRIPSEHSRTGTPVAIQIRRADSSIRYHSVAFHDPDETVLVPDTIESLQVVDGVATTRVRMTQTFSDYRRFIGASVVESDRGDRNRPR